MKHVENENTRPTTSYQSKNILTSFEFTFDNFKKVFWNRLDELGVDTHIIIGNHDTYYKNTNEVNAMQNLGLQLTAARCSRFVCWLDLPGALSN